MFEVPFTANARVLGSRQRDALQNITGGFNARYSSIIGAGAGAIVGVAVGNQDSATMTSQGPAYEFTFNASRIARTSTETRSANAAYHPRIHA
ncbi:hypothetical protein L505_2741 [Bordetella bronchiseptica F4563]|uniref:hypothetical protein n=1 Tax=Bordetella bronchiseptica TaxID=518 RepID=UPI00046154C6|nr:hypothetical protein [Bordetella bronchiseptica]KDC30173.1 hypothetical protein L505_2741 [Bordetella bronchiseptica F4563]